MTSRRRREPSSRSDPAQAGQSLWAQAWNRADGLKTIATVDEIGEAYADPHTQLWMDLLAPDRELLDELSTILGLHPLVAEDIMESNQRAKVELTGDDLHIVMFALSYAGEIVGHEIDIVLGERFLLTSHDADIDLRDGSFMRGDATGHLSGGPDYVLWALADWIVDGYFPVFDQLGDEIEELEADVLRRPSGWIVERLFKVRHDLLLIRHAVNPQREIFNQLTNRDLKLIKPQRIVYFRDVYDHLIRLTDELESYRELVSTALDIYLSQINNNLSDTMKRLTVVTVILAGAGALAGIFGMSEVGLALGLADLRFWFVAGAIGLLGVMGLVLFRRIGWI